MATTRTRELLDKARAAKARQLAGAAGASPSQPQPVEPAAPVEAAGTDQPSGQATVGAPAPNTPKPTPIGAGAPAGAGAVSGSPSKRNPFAALIPRESAYDYGDADGGGDLPSASASPPSTEQPSATSPATRMRVPQFAPRRAAAATAKPAQPTQPVKPAEPDPPWDDPSRPAGSQFSAIEWEAARSSGNFHVFEVRVADEGALFIAPAPPPDPDAVSANQVMIVDGKLKRGGLKPQVGPDREGSFLDPMVAVLLDGCLVLGPKAPTTHPQAVSGHVSIKTFEGEDWQYRIVRPLCQRETLGWLEGVISHLAAIEFAGPEELGRNASCSPPLMRSAWMRRQSEGNEPCQSG